MEILPNTAVDVDARRSMLRVVLRRVARYVLVDDAAPYCFALAVAVSNFLDGSPLWGMILGPSSGGKTEAIRLVDEIAAEHIDTLTGPSLLNWHKPKQNKPGVPKGILVRLGEQGFVTIKDFSTVLGDHGGRRDETFSMLRCIFDGELQRDVAGEADQRLRWEGRVTFLAACTNAIDNFSSHTDALGPRWLYLRLRPKDSATKRKVIRKAFAGDTGPARRLAKTLAVKLVTSAAEFEPSIARSQAFEDTIEHAAFVVCYGRASVPRESSGERDIIGIAEAEDPPRVAKQLQMLGRCLLAIGLTEDEALALLCRAAVDTMPAMRAQAFAAVITGDEAITAAALAKRSGVSQKTAGRALEDFGALGLIERKEPSGLATAVGGAAQAKPWTVTHPDAAQYRSVFQRASQPILIDESPG